ncbi:MAG: GNAT family N-acetyltransferase [Anaerolineae bacterium]|nr:GNAT family N-acetyltransferase [Anaerolineae bacterium]
MMSVNTPYLRPHDYTLKGSRVVLRPMTENDWGMLLVWNNDPDVLYYVEGDDVQSRTLDEIQAMYRSVSQNAFCFILESDGQPIGECWLQNLNLNRLLTRFPDYDCRRIDLMIGDKAFWHRGIGTEAIRLLSAFAFDHQQADYVFGCDVADYNLASQKAFQKTGFRLFATIQQPPGSKARSCSDFVLSKANFTSAV